MVDTFKVLSLDGAEFCLFFKSGHTLDEIIDSLLLLLNDLFLLKRDGALKFEFLLHLLEFSLLLADDTISFKNFLLALF